MLGYFLTFLAGGFIGMMGMAALSCISKSKLQQHNFLLAQRLDFLEKENAERRFSPVKDPRPQLHKMVN